MAKARIYAHTTSRHAFFKLLSIQENAKHEVMICPAGLDGRPAQFAYEYYDELLDHLGQERVNFDDKRPKAGNFAIDHFMLHADNRFHLKLKQTQGSLHVHPILLPDGELNFIILTDLPAAYTHVAAPKTDCPATVFDTEEGKHLMLQVRIYPNSNTRPPEKDEQQIPLGSFVLSVVARGVHPGVINPVRPAGTWYIFRFVKRLTALSKRFVLN